METKSKKRLTVALAVYNESQTIDACLSAAAKIADEIIIVDGGSTDDTVARAQKYTPSVFVTDNPPIFHINKQKALEKSTGVWILQLDADEVIDDALGSEVLAITQKKDNPYSGYYIPRRNFFLGDWLRKGGQYPDYVIRLFKRGKGSFPQKSVHEQIAIDGMVGYIEHPLDHYSYVSVAQYWRKAATYIELQKKQMKQTGQSKSILALFTYIFVKPAMTFLQMYIRHKGFLDGWRGFVYALFSSLHFPITYIKFLSGK